MTVHGFLRSLSRGSSEGWPYLSDQDAACGLRRSPGLAVLPARPSRSVVLETVRCSVLRRAASALQSRGGDGLLAATRNFGGPPSSRARSLRLWSGAFPPAVGYKKPRITSAAVG